jgi:hypothetical protein
MSTYDSMKKSMQTTGLYTLDGKTSVDFELQAYAAGLDPVVEGLKTLKRESFLPTAESYGLTKAETIFGQTNFSGTADEARARLIAAGSVTPDDCTLEDIQTLMNSLGFELTIESDEKNRMVTYHITKPPSGDRVSLQHELDTFAPAHLKIIYEFPD